MGPWVLGGAGSVVVPPADDFLAQTYDQIVARRYFAVGQRPVTILIAYGTAQSYATQLHRPEICYPASNFKINETKNTLVKLTSSLLPASYLEASRGSRQDAVFYWTRIGNRYPQDLWQQRQEIATSAIVLERPDGVLVRLSIAIGGLGDEERVLTEFVRNLYMGLDAEHRALLFGQLITSDVKAQ